jgi:hypothetical protein
MALVIKDRVKEGTTTTGTGAISLSGAAATFSPFNSHMTNGDTTYYAIVHTSSGVDEWEVGLGTWNTGNTLTRTTVYDGSSGTYAVNFSSGTKNVFMVSPADKTVLKDSAGDVTIDLTAIDDVVIGGTTPAAGSFTTLAASGNVDLEGYIDMNPMSHPTHAEGRVYYDSAHKSLSFQSDISGVEHELGLEEHVRVYNNSGSTIAKGKPVYWSGNQNDVPTIGLANATSETKYNVQGLTAGSIANNSYGYVIVSGLVYDIDTSSLNAGENFFAGLTDGALQNASPTYPNFPMCLGWVIKSDASTGIVLVNQQNHSVNSFRVRTDAHVGGDLTVSGDLTVTGTQTTASSSNVELGASFQYLNAGDTIGESGTTQSTGSGLDDATFVGHFTGTASKTFYVKIDGTGTPDTFSWSDDNFATTEATAVAITGNDQTLADGIKINFGATTGHTLNDVWSGTAAPANVDTGLFTNYNTGGSGVGYTHTGIFWDASTSKWTVLSEYDPEPSGTINLADSSVAYATFKAGTFEGDLTGDVTGDVTGTATSANALATARTIGGVSFDGSANINLPGVNTTGNQDTTGNAATATALETARTIQLSGDVTGSVSFDGTGNVNMTTAVVDDSHAHVISNVDGLQAALDAKADDSTTITAGNGLTGGGTLGVNTTLTVGAGTGVTVNANDVAIGQDVATTASPTFAAATINGNITVTGTVDGRDVAADGTKLDGIESSADVTDTANVTAAGALMDSELTSEASVKALDQGVATTDSPTFAGMTTTGDVSFGDNDKAIFGAGSDLQIYHDGSNSVIGDFGTGELQIRGTNLKLQDASGYNYIAMLDTGSGGAVYLKYQGDDKLETTSTGVDVTGNITVSGTVDGRDVATDGTKLDGIEASADVTDTANVTAAGALMDSELTSESSVKALNQGVATTDSPTFVTANVTTVDLGDWTVTESSGVLYFATGGTNKMKLDASGNLTVTGNVTAYGTV